MIRYLIRRLVGAFFVLVIISAVTFAIFYLIGDPSALYTGRSGNPEVIAQTRIKLGLDKPVPVQYAQFLKGIFVGRDYSVGPEIARCPAPCLGYSFRTSQNVWSVLIDRAGVTFSLAIGAAILWLVVGVFIGIVSALRKGSIFDRAAMAIALAGVSLPIYFTGLISLSIFVYNWHLIPNTAYHNFHQNPALWARSLILPWVVLAFLYAALYARLTRSSMLETMGEDYVRTARAKGLRERTVVGKHGLRAALTPITTIFGLDLGLLLGGAILTEYTFSLNGIGKLAIDAIGLQDRPVILGTVLFAAFFIVVANFLVDLLYAVVDPRVRVT